MSEPYEPMKHINEAAAFGGFVTVGQLIERLKQFDPKRKVLIGNENDWWRACSYVSVEEHPAVRWHNCEYRKVCPAPAHRDKDFFVFIG